MYAECVNRVLRPFEIKRLIVAISPRTYNCSHIASVLCLLISRPLTSLKSSKSFIKWWIDSRSRTKPVVSSAYCVLFISLSIFIKNSFYSRVMKIKEYYNFYNFNYSSLNDCKIKQYINVMKQKYISHWNQTPQNSQKLSFYNIIKNNYSSSTYLVLTRRNPLRKTLLKLRISCHKLRIETGRYDNIPRNKRLCHFCNCNNIESY